MLSFISPHNEKNYGRAVENFNGSVSLVQLKVHFHFLCLLLWHTHTHTHGQKPHELRNNFWQKFGQLVICSRSDILANCLTKHYELALACS